MKKATSLSGSHGTWQGGVSWPMENYFQAEAFNLDKVLDEFEQNEGKRMLRIKKKNKNSDSLRCSEGIPL